MRAQLRRLRDVDPILIQAVIAAAISFRHIHDVAEAAGQGGWMAWAYPVSVDLLLVMAWQMIRRAKATGAPARGPWFWFTLSLAASLGANVATAGVLNMEALPVWLRIAVAGWPVLAFFGGSLLLHARKATSTPDEAAEAAPAEPPTSAEEPREALTEEEPTRPLEEPETVIFRTYAEVAAELGVAVETVRGWASQGHITKYPGYGPRDVLVDLAECTKRHHSIRRTVGV
ncbi:DUF2637 domain-containing protein [Streptomyces sp. NPDC006326]|uniref:DUF2637 domain-containing protein n=1 Tax=Streptomyces sp. NPDC006326 TaxID=3156752 RepID=UPI0033A101C1